MLGAELAVLSDLESALVRLSELEARYQRWRPVGASEARIRRFEEEHEISLAGSHREWLRTFGEAPICPALVGGRILDLDASISHFIYEDFAGRLASEFAYFGREPVSLAWDEAADEPVDKTPLQGTLCLGHGGCDELWVVVVSGREKGNVWGFVPGLEEELHPTGLSVPEWHLRRIENALAAHECARRS